MSGNLKGGWKLTLAMLIFGSIGIFVRQISLTTLELVFYRVLIGTLFILLVMACKRQKPFRCTRKTAALAALSGVVLAVNWYLFFQAIKYTTVAIGTMTYYLAPVAVVFLAPYLLHEKLSGRQVGLALLAPVGLLLVVSGSGSMPEGTYHHQLGILCGLGAAVFYAALMVLNKKLTDIENLDRTLLQLLSASVVLSPVLLRHHDFILVRDNGLLLLAVGAIHTGVAYDLYLSGLKETSTGVTAVLSYIDPVSSVIFAALFLSERLSLIQAAGAGIVLLSTFLCTAARKPAS